MTITGNYRDSFGRFQGEGAFESNVAAEVPSFVPVGDVGERLENILRRSYRELDQTSSEDGKIPAIVCRASPGAGKSRQMRHLLADLDHAKELPRTSYHVPTLALAEEAAAEARCMDIDAIAIRGRSAMRPDGTGPMCTRSVLAERVSRLHGNVRDSLCERKEMDGTVHRCPDFATCAYLDQFKHPAQVRFLASHYLGLPELGGEPTAIRIVDETFWRHFLRRADVPVADIVRPRFSFSKDALDEHADLLAASSALVAALQDGRSPLLLPYAVDDYQRFAVLEYMALPDLRGLKPGAAWDSQDREIAKAEKAGNRVTALAAAWRTLAEAKAAGLEKTERLRLVEAEGRQVLRITWRADIKHDQPMLVLDADADTVILAANGLKVQGVHDLSIRPNAHVRQLHDRRMTTSGLLQSPDLRESWRRIIMREVFEDRRTGGGGVLIGATRKVVRAMFEDAGHSFSEMPEDQISRVMLETPLHGASWLWFGGGSLGSNRFETCTRVIVIGREELPIDILEDQGRALFGDTQGASLTFVAKDSAGRTLLPQREVPYLMADGSAKAVNVPCHPDPRIHLLQQQSREFATRQLIERLRLARATSPKHVLVGCNIPIPRMPVDRLVSWEELCPDRLTAALFDSLTYKGGVRLTPEGLSEGSPGTFSSVEAARVYLKRRNPKLQDIAKWFADSWLSKDVLAVAIRSARVRARTEAALLLCSDDETMHSVAERLWGPMRFIREI